MPTSIPLDGSYDIDIQVDPLVGLPQFLFFYKIAKQVLEETAEQSSFSYRDYQAKWAAVLCLRRCHAFIGDMGCGKTLISGLTIASLFNQRLNQLKPASILIAARDKASLLSRWQTDLLKIPAIASYIQVVLKATDVTDLQHPIVLVPMDTLKLQIKGRAKGVTVARYLRRHHRCKLLIIDEVHDLRPGSLRYKTWATLRARADRLIVLSGSIADGDVERVFDLGYFVYGPHWPYNRVDFVRRFVTKSKLSTHYLLGTVLAEKTPKEVQHLATTARPEYFRQMQPFLGRLRLSDPGVIDTLLLPSLKVKEHALSLSPDHRVYYLDVLAKHRHEIRMLTELADFNGTDNLAVFALIQKLLSACSTPKISSPTTKDTKLYSLITQRSGKIAIFCHSITGCEQAYEIACRALTEQGLSKDLVFRFHANLSPEKRCSLLSDFVFGDKQVGVFSLSIAAQSLDLTSAQEVIFYEHQWRGVQVSQAIARVVRPGNPNPIVTVHHLYYEGTISQHVWELCRQRINYEAPLLLDANPVETEEPIGMTHSLDLLRESCKI